MDVTYTQEYLIVKYCTMIIDLLPFRVELKDSSCSSIDS